MKVYQVPAALTLALALTGPTIAQSNIDTNKETQKQLKQEHKADKAQVKANREGDKTTVPQ